MKIKRTHVLVCLNPKFPNFYEIWFYDYLKIYGIYNSTFTNVRLV